MSHADGAPARPAPHVRCARGVLDPLMARVLVLEAGEKRLALVDTPEKLREAVRQSWGPRAGAAFDRRYAEGLHAH